MKFPENPSDGYKFNYRGRIFRWVSKPEFGCKGMWVSEGASQIDDTVIIEQSPLWKDVVEKPDSITDLGVDNKIQGNNVTIQTRRERTKPDSLAPGEMAVVEATKVLYSGTTAGGVIKVSGGSGIVDEAPITGKLYGRKDESWEDISDYEGNISDNAQDIADLRDDFENHDHALDDLSDVTSKDPKRDDLIIWNGQNWASNEFAFIETTIRFKGGIDMTGPAPANPQNGDLWVNDNEGTIDASWGEISGREVLEGKFVGWAESTGRWHLLGDMANVGVTKVLPATGITVDDSKPSEPVVGLDRDELDKWYADRGDTEESIENLQGQIDANKGGISDNATDIDNLQTDLGKLEGQVNTNTGDISTNAGDISDLRDEFEKHDHALNDLSDVNAASPTRDDLLVWNGSVWEANDFDFIQTALNFKGGINVANAAPAAEKGDLYVNDTEGPASASWAGIAGRTVKVGNFIGYANSRWYLLGDMADIGVTDVLSGLGISVDDSKPSEPVVNIDRVETDKWYADKGDTAESIKDLQGQIDTNKGGISDNATDIDNLQTDLGKLEGRVDDTEGDIEFLKDQFEGLDTDLGELQGQVNTNTGDISNLRNEFENHDHKINDLSDVNTGIPTRDDLLIWNGQNWVADDFAFIETSLRFKGGINMTGAAPSNPENGDLYVNDTAGVVAASWGAIAGTSVVEGKFVGWAESKGRWFLLGDMASVGVTSVSPGVGISVDDKDPSDPVVSVDRTETDKWYQAKGNYLTDYTETDPTVPQHVKNITSTQISNWNSAHGWGDHSQEGYLKAGDIPDAGDPEWAYVGKSEDDGGTESVWFGYWARNPWVIPQSVAIGYNTNCGSYGAAVGWKSSAGMYGVAYGGEAKAGESGVAIGGGAKAMEPASIALGSSAEATKPYEFAISTAIKEVNFSKAKVQAQDYLDPDGNSIVVNPSDYVQKGTGGTVNEIKIVVGATGSDPNTLYFVV